MPQMSPMNWTILYVMFLILLLMVVAKIFFMTSNSSSVEPAGALTHSTKSLVKNNMVWEW